MTTSNRHTNEVSIVSVKPGDSCFVVDSREYLLDSRLRATNMVRQILRWVLQKRINKWEISTCI